LEGPGLRESPSPPAGEGALPGAWPQAGSGIRATVRRGVGQGEGSLRKPRNGAGGA
jgi:hypothetical protein